MRYSPSVSLYNTRLAMCLEEVGAWILHTLKLNYSKSIFSISLRPRTTAVHGRIIIRTEMSTYMYARMHAHTHTHTHTHIHPLFHPQMHLGSWYIAIPASQSSVITLITVQAITMGLDLGPQALPSHCHVPAFSSRQPLPCPSLRSIPASPCLACALVLLSNA